MRDPCTRLSAPPGTKRHGAPPRLSPREPPAPRDGAGLSALPVPRLLEHATVGAVELEPDLGPAAGQLAHVAALAPPRLLDLALQAGQLQLQALHLEHRRLSLLAARFDHELGEQAR